MKRRKNSAKARSSGANSTSCKSCSHRV